MEHRKVVVREDPAQCATLFLNPAVLEAMFNCSCLHSRFPSTRFSVETFFNVSAAAYGVRCVPVLGPMQNPNHPFKSIHRVVRKERAVQLLFLSPRVRGTLITASTTVFGGHGLQIVAWHGARQGTLLPQVWLLRVFRIHISGSIQRFRQRRVLLAEYIADCSFHKPGNCRRC